MKVKFQNFICGCCAFAVDDDESKSWLSFVGHIRCFHGVGVVR